MTTRAYLQHTGVVETLLILAEKHDTTGDSWILACSELRELLLRQGLSSINVEIIDSRALWIKVARPVEDSHPIFRRWDSIVSQILPHLGLEGWLALECSRWGYNFNIYDGNWPVTVLLTVPFETDQDWRPTREKIVNILNQFALPDVAVAILRGQIWRASASQEVILPDNAWETGTQVGMSIGPSGSTISASTFGAVLELKLPKNGEWLPLRLTCFHCAITTKAEKEMGKGERKCKCAESSIRIDELSILTTIRP